MVVDNGYLIVFKYFSYLGSPLTIIFYRSANINSRPLSIGCYCSSGISFSDNSELLGVAQSDNMVFVYRVGADWTGKKVICNKFPLTGAPTALLPAENGFSTGTSDGKIRLLYFYHLLYLFS